jgi:NurA-like 5'-3' nuclease
MFMQTIVWLQFEEEINNLSKDLLKKNLQEKRSYVNGTVISNFLLPKILIKKMMYNKNKIWKI